MQQQVDGAPAKVQLMGSIDTLLADESEKLRIRVGNIVFSCDADTCAGLMVIPEAMRRAVLLLRAREQADAAMQQQQQQEREQQARASAKAQLLASLDALLAGERRDLVYKAGSAIIGMDADTCNCILVMPEARRRAVLLHHARVRAGSVRHPTAQPAGLHQPSTAAGAADIYAQLMANIRALLLEMWRPFSSAAAVLKGWKPLHDDVSREGEDPLLTKRHVD